MGDSRVENLDDQIISDIEGLQQIEKNLFDELERGVTNRTLDEKQKDKLMDNINKISDMRMNLYGSINTNKKFYKNNVESAIDTVGYQLDTLEIVEKQLNEAKKRLQVLEEEKYNNFRHVEINQYYSQKYANYVSIIKVFVVYLILFLIVNVFYQVDLLSNGIHNILMIGLVTVGIIQIGTLILDAYKRSNMYYDEYNFGKPDWPPQKPIKNDMKLDIPDLDECFGQQCCSADHTYVMAQNKCVANTDLPKGVQPYKPPKKGTSSLSTVSLI